MLKISLWTGVTYTESG